MATVALTDSGVSRPRDVPVDDRQGWGFALLLATTATLFVRPADLLPVLDKLPIYQVLIVACLVVSARTLFRQLANTELSEQPVTACLLALLLAIGASHLAHGFIWGARMSMLEFGKTLAFYLLVTGLINTPRRLFLFSKLLAMAISVVAGLAVLDRFDIVSVSALESIRDRGAGDVRETLERIRGTGIFHDPNDFGLILVTGLTLSVGFLCRPGVGWPRHLWLLPSVLLFCVLAMTHSRGAFLSLACTIPAAVAFRRGIAIGFSSLLILPLLGVVVSSRMTDFNAIQEGTGQTRIQIWSESLFVWRNSPFFGIGEGMLVEELGVVAHNSFIHCFAELGFIGGTVFIACFLAAGVGLWRRRAQGGPDDPTDQQEPAQRDLQHLRIFIFAALVAYACGMLALSRQFIAPTYLVLGLASAAQSVQGNRDVAWRIDNRFVAIVLATSATMLLLFYLAVRIFVRW